MRQLDMLATGRRRDEYDRTAPLTWLLFAVHREAGTAALPLSTFHPLLAKSPEEAVREQHPIFLF